MSVTDLHKIISIIPDIMKFAEASQNNIDICIQSLLGLKKIYIPDDYIEFLKNISDGVSVNGISLFGTIDQKYKIYLFPSLITVNKQFSDIMFLKDYLIIGQFFNLYIVYNYNSKLYEIINLTTNSPIYACFSFERLFYELLIKRNDE